MDGNPGFRYVAKIRGGIRWYMMQSKDFIQILVLYLKKENGDIVSFNGQSITFRFTIKKFNPSEQIFGQ